MILFVLKFITCLLDLFFHGCLLSSNSSKQRNENNFMLYNPPGRHSYPLHQGASQQLSSKTMRGSSILTKALLHTLRTHMSTCQADEWESCTGVKTHLQRSEDSVKHKSPSVYLTPTQLNTQDITVTSDHK